MSANEWEMLIGVTLFYIVGCGSIIFLHWRRVESAYVSKLKQMQDDRDYVEMVLMSEHKDGGSFND